MSKKIRKRAERRISDIKMFPRTRPCYYIKKLLIKHTLFIFGLQLNQLTSNLN